MGSKLSMLDGVLGESVLALARSSNRFVDLFAGSGSVAQFVATRVPVETVAVDLQSFSSELTGAVTRRTRRVDPNRVFESWAKRASIIDESWGGIPSALTKPLASRDSIQEARKLSSDLAGPAFILRDYGGHYFSPLQAWWLSVYHRALPLDPDARRLAMAALLRTASRCSASPGHTAQPFQPTDRLRPHIRSAWAVGVPTHLRAELSNLAGSFALRRGKTVVGDGLTYAGSKLRKGDLVFCDPPYSDAQYSRFYHVLEGIAIGGWPQVSGAGRSPEISHRASSSFSRRTESVSAMGALLKSCALASSVVMITYPEGHRSNGLTVEAIREMASKRFRLEEVRISNRHSTLGGSSADGTVRSGRKDLHEVLFTLHPLA